LSLGTTGMCSHLCLFGNIESGNNRDVQPLMSFGQH
jgi:hypothetical protein